MSILLGAAAVATLIGSASSLIAGHLSKREALEDMVSQLNLGIANLGTQKNVTRANIERAGRSLSQLDLIEREDQRSLTRAFQQARGRNVAQLGRSAVTLKGSAAALMEENKRLYGEDMSALSRSYETQREALTDEISTYQLDIQGMDQQIGLMQHSRSLAYERKPLRQSNIFTANPIPITSGVTPPPTSPLPYENATGVPIVEAPVSVEPPAIIREEDRYAYT